MPKEIKDPKVLKAISEFVAKMNSLGITPFVDAGENYIVVGFKVKEFFSAMKESIIKNGVPEKNVEMEMIPFGNDYLIKLTVKK